MSAPATPLPKGVLIDHVFRVSNLAETFPQSASYIYEAVSIDIPRGPECGVARRTHAILPARRPVRRHRSIRRKALASNDREPRNAADSPLDKVTSTLGPRREKETLRHAHIRDR